ncbi:carbohydrate sulfotransferase 10-like [Portunus trituberculatus]|nr:carbohydrate sulfotransferase 10-like [Portunus trituberculatus]
MLTAKKFVISLAIFTVLLYINIYLTKVTKTQIIEYYNDIMKERKPSEHLDKKLTLKQNRKSFNESQQDEVSSVDMLTSVPSMTLDEVVTPRKDIEVVFPSITNCSIQDYQRQVMRKHYNSRAFLYACKKWQQPNPGVPWPMVVPPSNGSVLRSLPVRHQNPEVERLLQEQAAVQAERVRLLTDTCLHHPELATRWYFRVVWDTSRTPPLVYCPVYKVASTTWSVYFLRLAHTNIKKKRIGDLHTLMSDKYPPPKTNKERHALFPKSLRFITVRHPFTRLLSAYRDKIDNVKPKPFQPYFLDLQRAIIQKYRAPHSNNTEPTPTFPEFVQYVIDATENFTTAKDWAEHVVCWTPYWVQCAVCSSDYQVVIKLETMYTDVQFLAEVAQLKEIQNVKEWFNKNKSHGSSPSVIPDYFEQLTKKQINLLYQRYKLDFDLFGYSIEEYLSYGRT